MLTSSNVFPSSTLTCIHIGFPSGFGAYLALLAYRKIGPSIVSIANASSSTQMVPPTAQSQPLLSKPITQKPLTEQMWYKVHIPESPSYEPPFPTFVPSFASQQPRESSSLYLLPKKELMVAFIEFMKLFMSTQHAHILASST
jgi:hypothetical protein